MLGTRDRSLTDAELTTPPVVQEQGIGDAIPPLEDPRAIPGFDEAYDTVCQQTISGLDVVYAAVDSPDLMATIQAQHLALTERIASVYEREDLWSATDPLVLEYAQTIVDDLASILDGTEVGFDYLDGDVALFRSLCEDWVAPI